MKQGTLLNDDKAGLHAQYKHCWLAHEFKEALQEVWNNEALGNPCFDRRIACARRLRTNPYVMGQKKNKTHSVRKSTPSSCTI